MRQSRVIIGRFSEKVRLVGFKEKHGTSKEKRHSDARKGKSKGGKSDKGGGSMARARRAMGRPLASASRVASDLTRRHRAECHQHCPSVGGLVAHGQFRCTLPLLASARPVQSATSRQYKCLPRRARKCNYKARLLWDSAGHERREVRGCGSLGCFC